MVLDLRPRRKEAIKYTQQAKKQISSGNYTKAIFLINTSNSILNHLIFESRIPNPFSPFHLPVQRSTNWLVEILKDLGNNYLILAQAFYYLNDFKNFNIALKESENYFLNYRDQKKTEEGYFVYLESLVLLTELSERIQDIEKVFYYLNKYFLVVNEILDENINLDQENIEQYKKLSKKYFNYLKNHPDQLNEIKHGFALYINQIRHIKNYENFYLLWAEPALSYLIDLENVESIDRNIEFLLSVFLSNVINILIRQKDTKKLSDILDGLDKILLLIEDPRAIDYFYKKFNEISNYFSNIREYDQEIRIEEKLLSLMEKNNDIFDQYDLYLQYRKLFNLYRATGKLEKILNIYSTIDTLLESIKWNDEYKDSHNFLNKKVFDEFIKLETADLHLKYASVKLVQKDFKQAKEAYIKAEQITSTINKSLSSSNQFKSLINGLQEFELDFNKNSTIGDLKDEREKIKELSTELNSILNDLRTKSNILTNEEIRNKALEAAEILSKLENFSRTREIIDPNQLLKYYFYILQYLDLEKEEILISILLRKASTLKVYKDKVDPVILASILNGLINFSEENERMQLIQEALNLIENKKIDLSDNPSLLADIYFNEGLIKINEIDYIKGYEKIDKAILLWEKLAGSNPEVIDRIQKAQNLLCQCKTSLGN